MCHIMTVFECSVFLTVHKIPGETEREVGILSKISNILMKLKLNNQAKRWLKKELELTKHCELPAPSVAGW